MAIEEQAKSLDIKGVMVSLIVSAFGFVAALFWRDAIKAFVDELIPAGEGVIFQFYVAILVTIITVVAIFLVTKYVSKLELRKAIEISKSIKKTEKPKKRKK